MIQKIVIVSVKLKAIAKMIVIHMILTLVHHTVHLILTHLHTVKVKNHPIQTHLILIDEDHHIEEKTTENQVHILHPILTLIHIIK